MKKTLVLGASPNPERYSYKAVERLTDHGHPVIAYGFRKGAIGTVPITTDWPVEPVDTVTLYLNPKRQHDQYDRILALQPRRVIFNPGTENPEFQQMLKDAGIHVEEACTLVLLATGQYA